MVRGLVRAFKMIADSLKCIKEKLTDSWCVALVTEHWYVALVAESCRMEFPVGFFNAPNFFFLVYALVIYIYVTSNLTTLTLTEYLV